MQPIRTGSNDFKAYSHGLSWKYLEVTKFSDLKRRFRVRQCPIAIGWFDAPQEDNDKWWYSTMEADGSWTTPDPLFEDELHDTKKRHDDLSRNRILMFISAVLLTLFIITTHNIGASI